MRTSILVFWAMILMHEPVLGQQTPFEAGLFRGHLKIYNFYCADTSTSPRFDNRVIVLKRLDKREWRRGYRLGQFEAKEIIREHGEVVGCATARYLYGEDGQNAKGAMTSSDSQ